MDHSVITANPCELAYITRYDFISSISEKDLEIFKNSLKSYPDNDNLRQVYHEKRAWDKFKQTIVKNVIIDKQNNGSAKLEMRRSLMRCKEAKPPINRIDIKTTNCQIYFNYLGEMQHKQDLKAANFSQYLDRIGKEKLSRASAIQKM